MILRKHVPNSCTNGDEPERWSFVDQDELLALLWVKQWASDKYFNLPFSRYSQRKYGNEWILMAEWKNKIEHKWWVIGYLSDDIGLPEFHAA